jgi:hypothetical protein
VYLFFIGGFQLNIAPNIRVGRPSLLASLQKQRRPDKRDHRTTEKHNEIDNVKGKARVIHVHQAKRAAKMGERE